MLGDFIFLLFTIEKMDELATEQAYGAGFFGWHQGYWNVVSKDRLLISPGVINIGGTINNVSSRLFAGVLLTV